MLKINSNFKKLIKSFLILGLFGFSVQALATWIPPDLAPPNGNTLSPVHVGSNLQYKTGGLVLGGLRVLGGTLPTAIFDGQVQILGGSPGENKVLMSDAEGIASWATPSSGDSLWIRTGSVLSPLNPDDNVEISDSAVILKEGKRFLHNYGSTNSSANIFLGINSGNFSTTGKFNTGVGENTLDELTTGGGNVPSGNTAVGYNALTKNTSAGENTAIGISALYNNNANTPNGGGNTSIGASSMFNNTSGNLNVAVGFSSLFSNTSGIDNIGIGRNADVSSGALSNAIAIGASTTVNASNKVRIGNSLVTVYETQVPWTNPSDMRLKKDITESDLGLDFINNLHPVFYRLKTENESAPVSYGFIAQDVLKVLDGKETNIVTQSGSDDILTMRYNDLVAPMVKAIQEQQIQIEELKKEIEILKTKQ